MIQIYENKEFGSVRTVEENGKIMFCGSDIAKALGYAKPNNAIATHCKGYTLKQGTPHPQSMSKTIEMTFITEGDVYRLIAHSKLPNAQKFESWVFDEVLPSIRKHGAYMTPMTVEEMLLNPDAMIELLKELKAEREQIKQLEMTTAVQQQQISELKPKASYYDVVLNCKDLMSITKIAKDYGWSAQSMNDYLHKLGVQFKQSGMWLLYQKYAEQGYTSTKTHTYNGNDGLPHSRVQTYWTQKGRLFIYELLKKKGILPNIEKEN
jgi:prophage antirepressor-like protein